MSEVSTHAERVQRFIVDKFPATRKASFSPDDNLLDSGLIDSLGVLELVGFMEREFSFIVSDDELSPENFGSINKIVAFVGSKTQAQAG